MDGLTSGKRGAGLAALALCAALAPWSGNARAANSVLFRAHWQVGLHQTELQVTHTVSTIKFTLVGSTQTVKQHDVSVNTFGVTITFTKVYADGSAQVKVTYPIGTEVSNGKTTHIPLTHFYRIMRFAADGANISSTTYGAATVPKSVLSDIPDLQKAKFPDTPVSVGGTWTASSPSPTFGAISAHFILTGISSKNGRTVATIHGNIAQPVTLHEQGLTFAGPFKGTDDAQLYTDTFESVSPTTSTFNLSGAISGTTSGFKVKGTFAFVGTETDTPQP